MIADTPPMMNASMNFTLGYSSYDWVRGSKGDRYRMVASASRASATPYVLPKQRGTADEVDVRQYLANKQAMPREEDLASPRVFTEAVRRLDELRQVQPFLLVVDTFEPHEPFLPPMKYVVPYSDGYRGIEPIRPTYGPADYLDEKQLARMKALYSGEVTFVDRWAGHLFDALAERGLDESTLVVVMSDHGVLLGDHGLTGKPFKGTYPGLTDIALTVRHPRRRRGERSDVNASTYDVTPTVLSALDVEVDHPLDGGDLLARGGPVADREIATAIYADTLWVRNRHWLVVGHDYGRANELYDLRADPDLRRNLASRKGDVVKRLLDQARKAAGSPIPHYKV